MDIFATIRMKIKISNYLTSYTQNKMIMNFLVEKYLLASMGREGGILAFCYIEKKNHSSKTELI